MQYYNLRKPYPNELYHYGVEGMHWGQRRWQNYDGSYTAAGREHYGIGVRTRSGEIDEDLASVAALAAVTTLITIAPYAAKSIKKARANNFVKKCDKEREKAPIDPKTGLKLIKPPKTPEENVKRVNPKYHTTDDVAYHMNCPQCSVAMEMRNRGYDVQAIPNKDGEYAELFFKKCFKPSPETKSVGKPHPGKEIAKKYNVETIDKLDRLEKEDPDKYEELQKEMVKLWEDMYDYRTMNNGKIFKEDFYKTLLKEPKGSRGQMSLTWNPSSGHSLTYQISKAGKLIIYDGQSGEVYTGKDIDNLLSAALVVEYRRLDNLELDLKGCKEAVR